MCRADRNWSLPASQLQSAPLYSSVTVSPRAPFRYRWIPTVLFCLLTYVTVTALLQPAMCVGTTDSADTLFDGHYVPSCDDDPCIDTSLYSTAKLTVLYANVRGLRQASGELRKRVVDSQPHLIGLTETHLCKDPIAGLLPQGYKLVARLDRTNKGGGLLWAAKSHLLIDKVDLKQYNTVGSAEMLGIRCMGTTLPLCYTQKSSKATTLLRACKQYKLDHPFDDIAFIGDFNVHNPDWICSTCDADAGGIMAQEMCELMGLRQLIDFPTRTFAPMNTLDLVMCSNGGSALPKPGLGTSDHISIDVTLNVGIELPAPPPHKPTRMWRQAPWNHIKGDIKRALLNWEPRSFDTVDEAEASLDQILQVIIDKHVKWSTPVEQKPAPWWNKSCADAYSDKCKLFATRASNRTRYNAAVAHCRTVQNRAFAIFQKDLRTKISSLRQDDKQFWILARDIAGIDSARSSAAPSVDDLADHFASKMSNGKDVPDDGFVPRDLSSIPLSMFKVRLKRVKDVLRKIDPSKSANGVPPIFWKETASVVAPAVTKLFQLIVRKGSYCSSWKIQRITPPHKRGPVSDPSNYRPLSVLVNLSVYFEHTVGPQFDSWIQSFVPESQFGFVKGTGTDDYGSALTFEILKTLDQRGEGILISLDVKGAFDRVWWARLKARLKAKGLRKKALKLLHSYLWKRFIQVVNNGQRSSKKEIFSGVPQGAIWSPDLWDFDISEMESFLSSFAMLICYADDCGLWYPITDENRLTIVDQINKDLDSLLVWADDNNTTFEPSKTHFTLISKRTSKKFDLCFPFPRIMFDGVPVKRKKAVKLVGYTFDEELTWSEMIATKAKKARMRLGMLSKLRRFLDDANMKLMYTSFIRPIMEYGGVQFMGADITHLKKLDSVQAAAEKIGRFTVETLASRREASAVAFTLKLLAGKGRGVLKRHVPEIITRKSNKDYDSMRPAKQLQLADRTETNSLDIYIRSYLGSIHKIWSRLPLSLLVKGEKHGWQKITKKCKEFITGKVKPPDVKRIITHKNKECSLDASAAEWKKVADTLDGQFNG
jgi:hypothetical protein